MNVSRGAGLYDRIVPVLLIIEDSAIIRRVFRLYALLGFMANGDGHSRGF